MKKGVAFVVLFNFRFPISSAFSQDEFAGAMFDAVPGLLDIPVDAIADAVGQDDFTYDSEDGTRHMVFFQDDSAIVFHVVRKTDTGVYTGSFVRADGEERSMLGVRVERQTNRPDQDDSHIVCAFASTIKDLFSMGAGEDDHGLPCRGRAVYVDRTSVDMVSRIFQGDELFYNSVVYVPFSSQSGEGDCGSVDSDKLARELFGMAHVVAEDSKFVATSFAKQFGDAYPKTVMMLMPTGHRHFLSKDSKTPYEDTVKYIKMASDEAVVDDSVSFTKLYMKHRIGKAGIGSEAENFYNELITEQEAALAAKDAEIEELRSRLSDIQLKSDALSYHLQKRATMKDLPSVTVFTKSDDMLFEGERLNTLLKLVKKEYDSMTGDSNQMSSRKYHLLGEILECNEMNESGERKCKDELADILKDGVLTPEGIRRLERMAFTVSKSRNGHWKVAYMGDASYAFSLSSSPSDYRSGENSKSDVLTKMFGY